MDLRFFWFRSLGISISQKEEMKVKRRWNLIKSLSRTSQFISAEEEVITWIFTSLNLIISYQDIPCSYTKLALLSFLYCFIVKGKLISVKILNPMGFEPATPKPWYFHPNAYLYVLDPKIQASIDESLTWLSFVHQWILAWEELRELS